MALALPGLAAGQVEAWRAQHDSQQSDPASFFDLFGFLTFPSQPTAMTSDLAHLSAVSVLDGTWRTMLVRHDATGELEWTLFNDGAPFAGAVAVDADGNAYLSARDGEGCSILRKVAPDGNVIWTSALVDPPACDLSLSFLEATADGAVYAAGAFIASDALVVARFASDGAVDWSFVRELEPDTQGTIQDLAVDSTGAVVTGGSFWNPGTDFLVMKIDASGDLVWERSYDNGSLDAVTSIAIGPEDRVTVSGQSFGPTGNDYYTIQYDASGTEIWNDRIERNETLGFFSFFSLPAIAADSTGAVYLTGSDGTDGAPQLLLAKYSAAGAGLFVTELPALSEGRRIAVVDSEDRVYVAGPTRVGDFAKAVVYAFDLDGALLWQESSDSALQTVAAGLAAGEGLVVMAGSVGDGEGTIADTFWLGLDPDGEVVWSAGEPVRGRADLYCGSLSFEPIFNRPGSCLSVGADGSVYLSGSDTPLATSQFASQVRSVKLEPGGAQEWTRGFIESDEEITGLGSVASALGPSGHLHAAWLGVSNLDSEVHLRLPTYDDGGTETSNASREPIREAFATGTDSTGAVYVAGTDVVVSAAAQSPRTTGGTSSVDVLLVKFQPASTEAWARTFGGDGGGADRPLAMLVTADDRIVYVGQASVSTRLDALARGYDTDGDVLFTRTLDSAGGDARLTALAAAPAGTSIVAVGRAKSVTDFDALVVRLDAAGNVEWRRDLDGEGDEAGDDEAAAVAVDPLGNIYVAGHTWNGDDFDVLIVKLDADGIELWRRAIDSGHGDDDAWSAAFDAPGAGGSPGSLWIAGRAANGHDTDALTLRFDPEGNELFRDVVAGTEQRDDEHYDLVVGPPGHATVAGVSAETDQSYNFQAIRYVPSPLDVDYDGEAETSTDGALIAQWLFGVLGEGPAASVAAGGPVDPPCVRCTLEEIVAHLAAIGGLLDVDGNGDTRPLTDGILLLRWLSDFHGGKLIDGAVDLGSCTRCDAPAIEAYLETLN